VSDGQESSTTLSKVVYYVSTSPLKLVFSDVWVQPQNLLVVLNIM
jgi:hypothetical protein